jgi:hypothetical protein
MDGSQYLSVYLCPIHESFEDSEIYLVTQLMLTMLIMK